MKLLFKSGRNQIIDNWYTSFDFAKDLLSEKITILETMWKNKRQIPAEFRICKRGEAHSSLFVFQQHYKPCEELGIIYRQ